MLLEDIEDISAVFIHKTTGIKISDMLQRSRCVLAQIKHIDDDAPWKNMTDLLPCPFSESNIEHSNVYMQVSNADNADNKPSRNSTDITSSVTNYINETNADLIANPTAIETTGAIIEVFTPEIITLNVDIGITEYKFTTVKQMGGMVNKGKTTEQKKPLKGEDNVNGGTGENIPQLCVILIAMMNLLYVLEYAYIFKI